MTCREIPSSVLSSARSLEDVYSQLGVRRGRDGNPLSIPDLIRPDDATDEAFPYLGGSGGLDYNLGVLYDDDQAGLRCVLTSLGYDRSRAEEIDREINALGNNEAAIEARLNELSPGERRSYSIFSTLQVIEYFRTTGNTDGNQNIVSMNEIAAWAWERCHHDRATHQDTAAPAIRRFHALLGLAIFLTRDVAPTPRDEVPLVAGHPLELQAPEGGWRSGDRVFVDSREVRGDVPTSGDEAFTIAASLLTAGSHRVEIRRTDGNVLRTPVTVTEPPPPEETNGFSEWLASSWEYIAVGATSFLAGLGVGRLLGGRGGNGGPTSPEPASRTETRGGPNASAEVRVAVTPERPVVVSDSSRDSEPENRPEVVSDTSAGAEALPVDIAAELARIAGDQSPPPGGSNPPAGGVNADNVIMRADATPERRLDPAVVRAQVVLTYSEFFMSQAGREALADGRPLPEGASLIHGDFADYVDILTERIMAEFSAMASSNPEGLSDMWEAQRDRDFLPRRGVPDRLLVDVGNRQITQWTEASTPGFSADAPRAFGRAAEDRLRNTDSFRRGLVELLRDPVRIGR